LEVVVVPECYLHSRVALAQENTWRNQLLVADHGWIIDERRIGG
jgi:hypothetical protein